VKAVAKNIAELLTKSATTPALGRGALQLRPSWAAAFTTGTGLFLATGGEFKNTTRTKIKLLRPLTHPPTTTTAGGSVFF
jgi:hypothetical protein